MALYFQSSNQDFSLWQGDSLHLLVDLPKKSINMVFADPPYFLSNDGLTVKNGVVQSVNKGSWDKSESDNESYAFTCEWLSQVRDAMADNATIWISGTHHNIFTLGRILPLLGFKILNMITWEKPNPPPNFSCRYFTYSTEWVIWARKHTKVPHYFDYDLMKKLNADKQMKDVWRLPTVGTWEKQQGKHPTQKPLALLSRIMLASSEKGNVVLDPFAGSATTGIAAKILSRQFIGIEQQTEFLALAKRRYLALDDATIQQMKQKIQHQISIHG